MPDELLTAQEAARRLGISTASLYGWLGQSDAGTFVLRGQPVVVDYLQGGAKGQGRIKLEAQEVERLRNLMRVQPRSQPSRKLPVTQSHFPGHHRQTRSPGRVSREG